jgi:hypothetical protein
VKRKSAKDQITEALAKQRAENDHVVHVMGRAFQEAIVHEKNNSDSLREMLREFARHAPTGRNIRLDELIAEVSQTIGGVDPPPAKDGPEQSLDRHDFVFSDRGGCGWVIPGTRFRVSQSTRCGEALIHARHRHAFVLSAGPDKFRCAKIFGHLRCFGYRDSPIHHLAPGEQ